MDTRLWISDGISKIPKCQIIFSQRSLASFHSIFKIIPGTMYSIMALITFEFIWVVVPGHNSDTVQSELALFIIILYLWSLLLKGNYLTDLFAGVFCWVVVVVVFVAVVLPVKPSLVLLWTCGMILVTFNKVWSDLKENKFLMVRE